MKFYECIRRVTTKGSKWTFEEAEQWFYQIFESWSKAEKENK